MRTRVKICGLTRVEDAVAAAGGGADAIGLVFYPASPRAVSVAQAQAIVAALPPFVTVVGLFVDPAPQAVEQVLGSVSLDVLQFHGAESADFCRRFGRPFIKAVPMRPQVDLVALCHAYQGAQGLLVDSYVPGTPGGTGATFNWDQIPRDLSKPLILAGGLSPANVAAAVRAVRPYAVDVSSGVEVARGIKDAAKITAFINEVWTCSRQQ